MNADAAPSARATAIKDATSGSVRTRSGNTAETRRKHSGKEDDMQKLFERTIQDEETRQKAEDVAAELASLMHAEIDADPNSKGFLSIAFVSPDDTSTTITMLAVVGTVGTARAIVATKAQMAQALQDAAAEIVKRDDEIARLKQAICAATPGLSGRSLESVGDCVGVYRDTPRGCSERFELPETDEAYRARILGAVVAR